jgi:hypothetical protein
MPLQLVWVIIPEFIAMQAKKMRRRAGNIVGRHFINLPNDARISYSKLTLKETHYVDVRP